MQYTEEIWSDLTYEEKQAYKLYEQFQKECTNRGVVTKWLPSASSKGFYDYDRDGKYPGDKIRESKNWKYFVEIYDRFKEDENFDPYIFIEAVFRRLGKKDTLAPAQLRTKVNYDFYKEYRMKLKMTDKVSDEKQIMQDLMNTYKFIQRKLGKTSQLDKSDFHYFFNHVKDNNIMSEGVFFCIQEMISPYYYSIWNSSDQDIQDEISSLERLVNISALIRSKSRVYEFAKKVFKDDIS